MKKFKKKYQLWTRGDSEYSFSEFDTIEECIQDVTSYYTDDWYITKRVDINFIEMRK